MELGFGSRGSCQDAVGEASGASGSALADDQEKLPRSPSTAQSPTEGDVVRKGVSRTSSISWRKKVQYRVIFASITSSGSTNKVAHHKPPYNRREQCPAGKDISGGLEKYLAVTVGCDLRGSP